MSLSEWQVNQWQPADRARPARLPGNTALVGHTGFVGSALGRCRRFTHTYNSRNIADIAGRQFDLAVCAAAPASMWEANENPAADRANLERLANALKQVKAKRFVLVSTIAVLADAAAGHTETTARFEQAKAYGRNRRWLEEELAQHFAGLHILRLPALFGPGLKKNFVFDLANPVPSFIRPDRFVAARDSFAAEPQALLDRLYSHDPALGMWRLDRAALDASPDKPALTAAFEAIGFVARNFTNSASRFQYYNIMRLAEDIERTIAAEMPVLNVCSEPISAATICRELTGQPFDNAAPPLVMEDMRSDHAGLFGGTDGYLYGRTAVLRDLKAFHSGTFEP